MMCQLVVDGRKESESLSTKECPVKDHRTFEREEIGLFSYAFFSISKFLTKIDIF